ncbi:Choline dehydrogenase [Phytophthora cactorum]|uniref:Succinate-semialdehyde dehydrogenase, mitochondrial n=1 Tax=Phytophthora cactorum TaxID=29920 RepID=A0A8T1C9A7_9STRA|nr:Choline dehydrogenase [Phytophthora cactorum]
MIRHALHRSTLPSASTLRTLQEFDYVIVGGGSAGCVLANRLSADTSNSVLLVETGPKDRGLFDSIRLAMPAMLTANLIDDRYNWNYMTEPQQHLNGRRLTWPRGRVLGGSSSINAMIYNRGHALDYDDWQQAGADGWSYADCLPYFKKAQTHSLSADEYRGGDGPLKVTRRLQRDQPLYQTFLDAAMQAGYPFTDDVNGYQQEGVGWLDHTIHNGQRCSASAAYLTSSVLTRENLTVVTGTFVNKVVFEGKKAVGIEVEPFKADGHRPKQIRAKEVILSSGAINSPQLLMVSGVGDADQLKKTGIPVVHHLPAVGQNMEEHLGVYLHVACKKPVTLYHATPHFPHKMAWMGVQWLVSKTGMGTSSHIEVGGFLRSAPTKCHPDLKWQFLPGASDENRQLLRDGHAMMLHCTPLRATSRGYIKLRSANPRDRPVIQPNYLATETDRVDMRNGVRLTREVLKQRAFDEYRGEAISPTDEVQSDAEIDAWIRQYASTDYHPSSTNRMGKETDLDSVVDAQTRVHGLEGLRVVDASIMPNNVSGNLNAPTIMLAEKAADIILGNPALPSVEMATSSSIPTSQLLHGLAPIGQRQYQPLLSKLQRPDLVSAQGFINGKWVEAHGGDQFTVNDPATEQEIACVASMGGEDTRDAIAAASAAQHQWGNTTPPVRAKLLKQWAAAITANAEDLAIIGSMECGKPLPEAKWEIEFAVGVIEYFSHEIVRSSGFLISPTQPTQKILVMKEPAGVCGIISPWNFPYAILGLSLGPALAAGCTTVIKPAGETPLSMLALAKLAEEVDFPPGIINVITTSRDKSEEIGGVLTSSPDVKKMTFAGSTQVGKWLMRHSSETVKNLSFELGGNAPFIVFEDADLEKALDGLIQSKFPNTGQACIASNRIFVHSSIYDTFAANIVERVKTLKMGVPLQPGVRLGPLIGPTAVKKMADLVEDAVSHGAKVLVGGNCSDLGKNFYEATVLIKVDESMRIWNEEIFGPVLQLSSFSSEEEVVQKANDSTAGLAGYFYTQDVARIFRVASELECGMVGVNSELVTHVGAPFGGIKESGIGREGSSEGLDEYLETKMVCIGGL